MPQFVVRFRHTGTMMIALLLLALACARSTFAASLCYVNQAAGGANTGADWADAYTDLQSAVRNAACTQIWAAQGVYKPGTATTDSFTPFAGQQLYGGFAGTESSLAQRTPDTIAAHPTVLSGDIDGNDPVDANGVLANGANIVGNNSWNVVLMNGAGAAGYGADTVIDGFIISGGDALGNTNADSTVGGGMRCDASYYSRACNFTLSNMVFSGNRAFSGAALFLTSSYGTANATLSKVVFSGNVTPGNGAGGAVDLAVNASAGTVSPTFSNVIFSGNSAGNYGGAIDINVNVGTARPTFDNVTFTGNSALAQRGAAISVEGYNASGVASPTLRNSILWGDSSSAGEVSILYYASATFDHAIVQNGCPAGSTCSNVIATDPQLGALANHGGAVPSLLPGLSGAAVGAGTCVLADDIRGVARPQGQNTACDLGAVELREPLLTVVVTGDGSVSAGATPAPILGGISNCTTNCSAQYYAEAPPPVVTLTATPNAQRSFTGWSGDCSGSNPVLAVTLAAAATCTATFIPVVTPTILWNVPGAIVYGTPLDGTQLNASASYNGNPVAGTFAYTPPAGTVLAAGTGQSLSVVFTPSDATHYSGATASVPIDVARRVLSVTGTSVQNKLYDGTPTATLSGGALADLLAADAGNVTLTQASMFAQADVGTAIAVSAYDSISGSASANYSLIEPTGLSADIAAATLTYTAAPATFVYGVTPGGLSGTVSGFVSGESQATATTGTLIFTTTATASSPVGSYAINGGGLSANNGNYVFAQDPANAGALTIVQATPTLVWNAPNAIVYGTALGSAQLNATASYNGNPVAGTFAYTPPAGTVLAAGANQTLVVNFTPADSTDYTTATTTTTLTVNKAAPTITLSSACSTTFVAGEPFTLSAAVQGTNLMGNVAFNDGNGTTVCNGVALSAGVAACTYTLNTAAGYALGASYGGDANHTAASAVPFDVSVLSLADVIFRYGFEPESAGCPIE